MIFPPFLTVYGDTAYRGPCAREDAELSTAVNQIRLHKPHLINRMWHTENEGKKTHNQVTASKIKGELAGVSDLVLIGVPPACIEIKRKDHTLSKWQKGQLPFLEECYNAGAFVAVALGYEAVLDAIADWEIIANEYKRVS